MEQVCIKVVRMSRGGDDIGLEWILFCVLRLEGVGSWEFEEKSEWVTESVLVGDTENCCRWNSFCC